MVPCFLGISDCVFCIIERETRKLIFSMPCQAVLGWSVPPPTAEQMNSYERDLHIYYGRGERVSIHTNDRDSRDGIIRRCCTCYLLSKINSNLHYSRGITPKRVTNATAGVYLHSLAPGKHSFDETSQRWRAVGDSVPI